MTAAKKIRLKGVLGWAICFPPARPSLAQPQQEYLGFLSPAIAHHAAVVQMIHIFLKESAGAYSQAESAVCPACKEPYSCMQRRDGGTARMAACLCTWFAVYPCQSSAMMKGRGITYALQMSQARLTF